MGLVFDTLFIWAKGPAKIWAVLSSLAQVVGLCQLRSEYAELMLAAAFTFTLLFIELLFFTPFAFIDTFVVRKEHGYSKATIQGFL